MNEDNIFSNIKIDPPKVPLMESLKYKLGYFQGKPRVVTTVIGVTLMAGVSMFVAYASLNRRSITNDNIGAANPSCYLSLNLKTPPPPITQPVPTPTPTPVPTPVACNKNLDIALVIDRSATMTNVESDGRQKLAWAKDAAGAFINAVKNTGTTSVNIAITSFGAQGNDGTGILTPEYNSILHTTLSNNYPTVLTALSNVLFIKPGTCIECGLKIANAQLTSTTNKKVVILLSDGIANHQWSGTDAGDSFVPAILQAEQGRARGIEYRVLGYGKRELNQIAESELINIAGSTRNYQYKPDANGWYDGFLTILNDLCATTPPTVQTSQVLPVKEDSYVDETLPTTNFGTATSIKSDGSPVNKAFMKFSLAPLAGVNFKKAYLYMYNTNESSGPEFIKSTATNWSEATINYNNMPVMGATITSFNAHPNSYMNIVDVTDYVKANAGTEVSFGIEAVTTDGFSFNSKENTVNKPFLSIDY